MSERQKYALFGLENQIQTEFLEPKLINPELLISNDYTRNGIWLVNPQNYYFRL